MARVLLHLPQDLPRPPLGLRQQLEAVRLGGDGVEMSPGEGKV